jgi:dTDP-glucose 4,6-dehydratase
MIDSNLYSELQNKSILITGATGFFGKNLVEDLIKINNEHNLNLKIYALSRNPRKVSGVENIAQDVSLAFNFNLNVDYLIHAATPVVYDKSTNDELLSIIINGTKNAIDYSLKNNVKKFLLVSSGAVYGTHTDETEAINEELFLEPQIFDPKNSYATGKRISEHLCHSLLSKSKVNYSIARGFAYSGRYLALDQHLAIGNFVRDAVDTGEIIVKGNGMALRSYMDNEDLSNWLMTILLKSKNGEAYNLGSDQKISIQKLAQIVSECLPGCTYKILGTIDPQLKSNLYVPSIEKAKSELNLKLTINLKESIEKMIEIYRNSK